MPVSFSIGDATSRASCALANADNRPGLLLAVSDSCLENNIPVYGECGATVLPENTSELGAVAQVILGGVPDGDYPISINAYGFPGSGKFWGRNTEFPAFWWRGSGA